LKIGHLGFVRTVFAKPVTNTKASANASLFYQIDVLRQVTLLVSSYHQDILEHFRNMQAGHQDMRTKKIDTITPFDIHLILNADVFMFLFHVMFMFLLL
jgi:hypothetical protein